MNQVFPIDIVYQTTESWLPRIKTSSQLIYLLILSFIITSICILPLIKVDVTINSSGLIRPAGEKYELKSLLNGVIDQINVREGQSVVKGQLIMLLRQDVETSKLSENNFEQTQHQAYIHDLELLTNLNVNQLFSVSLLQSPLYKQKYIQFKYAITEQKASLDKAESIYVVNKKLFDQKVETLKEYQDSRFEYTRLLAQSQTMAEQQIATWQEEYSNYKMASNRLKEENKQVKSEMEWAQIKAPVSGNLQQFAGRYTGGHVQAGESLGVISPDSASIAECYLSPKDIGYIKIGMPVKFQVDAFNYNDWGSISGKVTSIDNDFVVVNDKPTFRVKCKLEKNQLKLKNGYKGFVKKGMTLHARFLLTKRSLFQLLYDRADNWLNPNSNS